MTPLYRERFLLPRLPIQGQLLLWGRRSRLYRDPEHKLISIGYPPDDPAGMIGPGMPLQILDGIIMLAAKHPGRRKTGTELNPPHSRDGKSGMGQKGFHRVPKRLPQPDRQSTHPAFDDAANR